MDVVPAYICTYVGIYLHISVHVREELEKERGQEIEWPWHISVRERPADRASACGMRERAYAKS